MNFRSVDYRQFWPVMFIGALIVSIIAQTGYDWWARTTPPTVSTDYNQYIEPEPLSGPAAIDASFGNQNFLADVYWLELIQYYGGGNPYGQYRQLPDLYNTITDLSPQFLAVYQNGLLILPAEGYVTQAIALGEKGQKNLPHAWQIPYYEGLVYHIYQKNYVAAAKEFQLAASDPGAPAITKYFAAIYYNEADQRQTALQIFQTVEQTTTDSFVKARAQKYIQHLQNLAALQADVTKYNQIYRHNPGSLQDLITTKIISAVPVSPLGLQYTYNAATGQVGDNSQ